MSQSGAQGYPLSFRVSDCATLLKHLARRDSVELIGMKRVGINNFLNFFLFHDEFQKKRREAIGRQEVTIFVDLNDLVERELFSFWRLTLKRMTDAIMQQVDDEMLVRKVNGLFLSCIQSGDFFLTFDGVRECIAALSRSGYVVTLVFNRFDRIKDAVSQEFFDNLQSLKDVSGHTLSYIFTSYRPLSVIAPSVFDRRDLTLFSQVQYVPPASDDDLGYIIDALAHRMRIALPPEMRSEIIRISGGHTHIAQLHLIVYEEMLRRHKDVDTLACMTQAADDERVLLLCEELWDSLSEEEQHVLFDARERTSMPILASSYVYTSGIIRPDGTIFSPLFERYVHAKVMNGQKDDVVEFSRKEHMLFSLLEEHRNDICERELIVSSVWPEYSAYGVSDWSIDRLVARVRAKLKKKGAGYEIITVRTRGYKLIQQRT
jgi:hypothetical protein